MVAELIASKDGDLKTSYDFLYITKMEDINLEEFTDSVKKSWGTEYEVYSDFIDSNPEVPFFARSNAIINRL